MNDVQLACERGRIIRLDPSRTALACIDFQADFLIDAGMSAHRGLPISALQAVLPAAESVLHAARAAGVFVFHTREAYAPDLSDLNVFRRKNDEIIGTQGPLGRFLIRGEAGTEIVPSMNPEPGEPVIDKAGFNGFYRTTLDMILRSKEVDTLILMGITTQCCVASTLRGAVDLGYRCVLLQDSCASYDPEDHEATVRVMYSENHNFGWVSDSTRLGASLTSGQQATRAVA